MQLFIDLVSPFAEDPITEESEKEQDDMTYYYSTKTRVLNDEISLASNDPLEKLSISVCMRVFSVCVCVYVCTRSMCV